LRARARHARRFVSCQLRTTAKREPGPVEAAVVEASRRAAIRVKGLSI
jgi:hypothetical protein